MKAQGCKIVFAFVGLFLLTYLCLWKAPAFGIGMALGTLAVFCYGAYQVIKTRLEGAR